VSESDTPPTKPVRTSTRTTLTRKQQAFVREYVKDLNGTRAAMAAGVPVGSAGSMASQWLDPKRFPVVARAVEEALETKHQSADADTRRVVEELCRIAFFNPKMMLRPEGGVYELHELPDCVAAAVQSMSVSYTELPDQQGVFRKVKTYNLRFYNKLEALKQVAQHLGLLKDVTNVINQTNNNISIDWAAMVARPQTEDPLERRIREASRPLNGPVLGQLVLPGGSNGGGGKDKSGGNGGK